MRVLHVISSISRSAGGPARSVQGLVAGLNKLGVEAWLLTLRHGDVPWVKGVGYFANGEPFENVATRIRPNIVHLHGLWSLALHHCAAICRRWHIPYIVSPRGMLEPWSLKQKWLKKRIARWLYQDRDLKCAAALHATAGSEAEQFRQLGFKNPIIISPNGVNVPNIDVAAKRSPLQLPPETRTSAPFRRVLFVSRMHPKKGVMELVEAWHSLKLTTLNSQLTNWLCELVYTMNGDIEKEYEAKVKARVKELDLQDQFIFTGALNDDEKWNAYARADLFVLPTYSENFGIVVAEALWAGVPVITTKGTPWSELEGNSLTPSLPLSSTSRCGWWIDTGVEPLTKALGEALSLDNTTLKGMGGQGRKLVEGKYTWDAVVKKMAEGYNEVFAKKQRTSGRRL